MIKESFVGIICSVIVGALGIFVLSWAFLIILLSIAFELTLSALNWELPKDW